LGGLSEQLQRILQLTDRLIQEQFIWWNWWWTFCYWKEHYRILVLHESTCLIFIASEIDIFLIDHV